MRGPGRARVIMIKEKERERNMIRRVEAKASTSHRTARSSLITSQFASDTMLVGVKPRSSQESAA